MRDVLNPFLSLLRTFVSVSLLRLKFMLFFSKYANNVSFFRFVGQLCNVFILFYTQDAYFEFLDKYFWKVSECLAKKCLKDLVI